MYANLIFIFLNAFYLFTKYFLRPSLFATKRRRLLCYFFLSYSIKICGELVIVVVKWRRDKYSGVHIILELCVCDILCVKELYDVHYL